jgi:hypothetical protein
MSVQRLLSCKNQRRFEPGHPSLAFVDWSTPQRFSRSLTPSAPPCLAFKPISNTPDHAMPTCCCCMYRGSAGADEELVVLDAAHYLALPSAASATILTTPAGGSALTSISSRALGRTSSPDIRLAALHALASVAGLERAGEARDRSAALMPPCAEDALRRAVFAAVSGNAGGAGGARTPAEAVWQLLQQPFDETRTGVYRWARHCLNTKQDCRDCILR